MIYFDANALLPAVLHVTEEERSERVARLLRKGGAFHVSALSDYEVRKTLLTSGFSEAKLSQLDDLIAARFHPNADWDRAVRKALELARQFGARLVVDSADTLHVAWAMVLGAETFASFDRTKGPRALALSSGLKLWPDPTHLDYEAMSRLKKRHR